MSTVGWPTSSGDAAPADGLQATITLATYNTHSAMDGWGRRFDLVAACRRLDSDVVVLQEVFCPAGRRSQAAEAASELGYEIVEVALAPAYRRRRPLGPGRITWGPLRPAWRRERPLFVGSRPETSLRPLYEEGTLGLALLSRLPIRESETIELGKLRRDVTPRRALRVELGPSARTGDDEVKPARAAGAGVRRPLVVVATHAAHLTQGSASQLLRLRRLLPSTAQPAVLAGDMNMWGPPLTLFFKGWRLATKARSWPARAPHSQLDHILVTPAVRVLGAGGRRCGQSDHRAVWATLAWD